MRVHALATGLLAAVVASGCGGDAGPAGGDDATMAGGADAGSGADGGGDGGDGGVIGAPTFEAFLARYVAATCDLNVRCGTVAASDRAAACAFQHLDLFGPVDFQALLAKGTVVYDAANGTACLAAIETTGCEQAFVAYGTAACRQFFRGTVAVDGACSVDEECVGGVCMGRFEKGCPGARCVAYSKRGETCTRNSPACDPATDYCTVNGCAPYVALGSPCERDVDCGPDATCGNGTSKVCVPIVALGGGCQQSYQCAKGLACIDKKCVPARKAGEPCDPASRTGCASGFTCIGDVAPATCAPWLDVGMPCNPSLRNSGCPSTLNCDAGTKTCVPDGLPAGSPCKQGGDCYLSLCTSDGVCRAPTLLGEACVPADMNHDEQCFQGECSADSRTCALVCN